MNIELAPSFSFKPIGVEPSSFSDILDAQPSPTEIFRESAMAMADNNDCTPRPLPGVYRANPVQSQENMEETEDEVGSRVISPFSHTASVEEIEEREQLTTSLDWTTRLDGNEAFKGEHYIVNFSRFFDPNTLANNIDVMDCCDDFSLSSHEANDLSEDPCLETISKDPASFWEEGIDAGQSTDRVWAYPTEVSLGSSDSV
jgi:hypothetical protein